MKKRAIWWVPIGLLVAISGVSFRLHPGDYTEGRPRKVSQREQVNRSALGMMLGKFRTNLSDTFYMQTESFLHYGVAFKPHDEAEHETVSSEMAKGMADDEAEDSHHDHHDHAHEEEGHDGHHHEESLTIIPTAADDYRAWIGRMQREIQPWQKPGGAHHLASDAEVVPLFRLMTLADPHSIRGFTVGSYWVSRMDPVAAQKFLDEGLVKNPNAFQLHLMNGLLMMVKARRMDDSMSGDDPEQKKLLLAAKATFQKSADFMLKERPIAPAGQDVADMPNWSEDQETDAYAATNLSVVFEQKYGNLEKARQLAQRYTMAMPDHQHLKVLQETILKEDP